MRILVERYLGDRTGNPLVVFLVFYEIQETNHLDISYSSCLRNQQCQSSNHLKKSKQANKRTNTTEIKLKLGLQQKEKKIYLLKQGAFLVPKPGLTAIHRAFFSKSIHSIVIQNSCKTHRTSSVICLKPHRDVITRLISSHFKMSSALDLNALLGFSKYLQNRLPKIKFQKRKSQYNSNLSREHSRPQRPRLFW